jgi:hypothetical protein
MKPFNIPLTCAQIKVSSEVGESIGHIVEESIESEPPNPLADLDRQKSAQTTRPPGGEAALKEHRHHQKPPRRRK